MRTLTSIAVLALIAALMLGGCTKKEDSPTAPTVTHASGSYTGTLAGATTSGKLTLNIGTSKTNPGYSVETIINVTGSFQMAGDATPTTLTGTYNTDNDSLHLSSSNGFSFRGTYNQSTGALSGTYTTSGGATGDFVAQTGSNTTVVVYLGKWNSTTTSGVGGNLNFAVKGNALLGIIVGGTYKYPFSGVISGDSVTLSLSYSGFSAVLGHGAFTTAAHDSVSGTYALPAILNRNDGGTWSGKKAQ